MKHGTQRSIRDKPPVSSDDLAEQLRRKAHIHAACELPVDAALYSAAAERIERQAQELSAWRCSVPRCHCGKPATCDDWEHFFYCDEHRPGPDQEPADMWWAELIRPVVRISDGSGEQK